MRDLITLLLRSPLHRVLSRSVILLTVVGRRSGRTITLPVQYARCGDDLVVFPGHFETKQWWRNLEHAAPIEVQIEGRHRTGTGHALAADATASEEAIERYLRRYPRSRRAVEAAHSEARRRGIAVPMVSIILT